MPKVLFLTFKSTVRLYLCSEKCLRIPQMVTEHDTLNIKAETPFISAKNKAKRDQMQKDCVCSVGCLSPLRGFLHRSSVTRSCFQVFHPPWNLQFLRYRHFIKIKVVENWKAYNVCKNQLPHFWAGLRTICRKRILEHWNYRKMLVFVF